MAWSAPITFVAGNVLTASQLNAIQANLSETGPAKATTAGRLLVTTAANAIDERALSTATTSAAQTTGSTSYTDLTTAGPAVTVTTGVSALVVVSCTMSNNTAGANAYMGYEVSGASTVSASDDTALQTASDPASAALHASSVSKATGLTAGSNTFTAKYKVTSGTGTFSRRNIIVLGL